MSTQKPVSTTAINKNVLIQKVSQYWEEEISFPTLLNTLTELEMTREEASQHGKGADVSDGARSSR